jgi:subtilisin family serine protease
MDMLRVAVPSALMALAAWSAFAQNPSKSLPSEVTQSAIRGLTEVEPTIVPKSTEDSQLKSLTVKRGDLQEQDRERHVFSESGQTDVPFVVPNTMILQLEPNVSTNQLDDLINDRNLSVIQRFPEIGAIQVETDLSRYFKPQLSDNSVNDTVLRGLVDAIEDFQSDPRVRSAAPDLLMKTQNITNLSEPADIILSTPLTKEQTDWGISDIEADQVWVLPGATNGKIFGVMDAGFAQHEDLVFLDPTPNSPINSHGNHVAGIACGRHNEKGAVGVLPNCFVRVRSGDFFFDSSEGGDVLNFVVSFSQILGTLLDFVENSDDVRTFNVSLGYNWRSNFGINPDLPESAQWRTVVASQGSIMVTVLERADEKDKVIYSAAGNDSTGLTDPVDAKFASPFNWGAITAREKGLATNGVIVEAHDALGNRAVFSNEGGDISCPGVDIFSAVAFDAQGDLSDAAYGTMSGTSMASPYCAAGHSLLTLVRPSYSSVELVECMTQSNDVSSSGTPMLKLTQALNACPDRS